ncbi:hypothetical protein DAEQUDRAFT_756661 [Daedalea quercina L-15889]|uniref:F-box domain-containing protein n=1 Tax=Daedalea quercina L-15889 TaxID=1314783 RepID=A0A165QWJ0_9APHY|nr:hypothetical protein DAEQUDRAFT_756661 [Daedalea quercina L-15889]
MYCRRYIPQELCDEVVDYLWDDIHTLKACAMTCRSWVWRSQKHLFRDVAVNNATRFERFMRLLKSNNRIALYVRVLTIAKARRGKTKLDKRWHELLQRLPHVEQLTIGRWVDLFPMEDTVQQNLPVYFARVRVLCIVNSFVGSSEDFARVLTACPAMRTLYLDNARVWPSWSQSDSDDSQPIVLPRLDTLSLNPTHVNPMTRFWINGGVCANIRRLELELATSDMFIHCEPLLRALRDTLEEIVLCVIGSKQPRRPLAHSIPPMKRLRRVHLRTKMLDAKEPIPRRYEWMLRFLRLLGGWESKNQLTEIALSWRTSDLSNTKHPPAWAAFDAAMTDLAKANAKVKFVLNIFDNTGIQNPWYYMTCLGLQTFPSLQGVSTTLMVNMGASWSEDETFGGTLSHSRHWEFKYEQDHSGQVRRQES